MSDDDWEMDEDEKTEEEEEEGECRLTSELLEHQGHV